LSILWHAAGYRLSVENLAEVFVVTQQTILNWRRVMHRKDPHLLPPLRGLPELVHDLVHRLKAEWPQWGTRRIAGQLARLGVKASRSSVQRILRRRPRPPEEPVCIDTRGRVLLAKRPDHIWMLDFTRVGGLVRPLWIGAVIDAFSRRVLAVGAIRGAPSSAFAVRLLRRAMRRNGTPGWLVTDKDPVLRAGLVQRLLTTHGILRRYGAVGRRGSIALIERTSTSCGVRSNG
jgi:transposase InsO family protein